MKNDMKRTKENRETRSRMRAHLAELHNRGAGLFVDGEAVLPEQAVKMTVREDCLYMADYIFGESGNIEQIRFDKLDLL